MKKTIAALLMSTALASTACAQGFSYPGTDSGLSSSRTYRVKDNVEDGFLNMREGPGVRYKIMTRIPAGVGDIESKDRCARPQDRSSRHPFCLVKWHKFTGWMSQSGLEAE